MKLRLLSLLGGACVGLFALVPALAPPAFARQPATSAHSSAYAQGQALMKVGKYGAAERAFRLAIKQNDHVVLAWQGVGNAAIGERHYGVAFSAFKHDAALQPGNSTYQYNAGYAALSANNYHQAVNYATIYIKLRPRDFRGYHLRFLAEGHLFDGKGQLNDATEEVRLRPRDAEALNDLGIGLANSHRFKAAIPVINRAIKLQPNNGDFYANRGLVEYELKQYPLALRDFKRAQALTHDTVRRRNLGAAIAALQKQIRHK